MQFAWWLLWAIRSRSVGERGRAWQSGKGIGSWSRKIGIQNLASFPCWFPRTGQNDRTSLNIQIHCNHMENGDNVRRTGEVEELCMQSAWHEQAQRIMIVVTPPLEKYFFILSRLDQGRKDRSGAPEVYRCGKRLAEERLEFRDMLGSNDLVKTY